MSRTSDAGSLDATGQAELVRRGEVSPLELVDEAIARIERLNPTLKAVIHQHFERARIQAAGELPDGPNTQSRPSQPEAKTLSKCSTSSGAERPSRFQARILPCRLRRWHDAAPLPSRRESSTALAQRKVRYQLRRPGCRIP